MPSVHGLSHVVLLVEDVEKMKTFYRDVLGFAVSHESPGRSAFLTSYPEREDHEIALFKGREGTAKLLNHIALHVDTVEGVREFYQLFKQTGVQVNNCTSHGHTASCYFLDPEGNQIEVYALVDVEPGKGYSGPIDFTKSTEEITAQIKGLAPVR